MDPSAQSILIFPRLRRPWLCYPCWTIDTSRVSKDSLRITSSLPCTRQTHRSGKENLFPQNFGTGAFLANSSLRRAIMQFMWANFRTYDLRTGPSFFPSAADWPLRNLGIWSARSSLALLICWSYLCIRDNSNKMWKPGTSISFLASWLKEPSLGPLSLVRFLFLI